MGKLLKPVFINLPSHLINRQHVNSLEVHGNFVIVGCHGSPQSIP